MFRFEDPWFLLLALSVPLVVWDYVKRGSTVKIKYSSIEPLKNIKAGRSVKLRHSLIVFRALALILLVLALARPQTGSTTTEYSSDGVDIMLCLDTSGSMEAMDFELKGKRRTRLFVVKDVVKDFINAREHDRIGMVVFGDDAYTQCPLTLDYDVLSTFLRKTEIGVAGQSTAIGSAIAMSVKRLKDVPAKSKIIILLTDGVNNAGRISPEIAAGIAKSMGIKIYTIGVGSNGLVPFKIAGIFGGSRYVKQQVELDEETLKAIAKKTGGMYFKATDTAGLKEVYRTIDELEKTEVDVKIYTDYNDFFPGFLLFGLIFLITEVVLGNTRFRKIP